MRLRCGAPGALELLEAGAADELGDHHALARERPTTTSGTYDERVAAEDPRHRALVGGLELVVELLVDPQRGSPAAIPCDVEAGRHPREQPHDHPEVLEVGAHGARDAPGTAP